MRRLSSLPPRRSRCGAVAGSMACRYAPSPSFAGIAGNQYPHVTSKQNCLLGGGINLP